MLCRIDICCTSYSHWLSVMSSTRRRCHCSCGLAQDMKHCCWVGLLLGCHSTAWPLSPNYSKRQQCCVTDWTIFHCKYRTDRAKARPQKCCHVCYIRAYGTERNQIAYHCHIAAHLNPVYHITRSCATADRPRDVLCQLKSCQLLHNCMNKLYNKSK